MNKETLIKLLFFLFSLMFPITASTQITNNGTTASGYSSSAGLPSSSIASTSMTNTSPPMINSSQTTSPLASSNGPVVASPGFPGGISSVGSITNPLPGTIDSLGANTSNQMGGIASSTQTLPILSSPETPIVQPDFQGPATSLPPVTSSGTDPIGTTNLPTGNPGLVPVDPFAGR